MTDKSKIFGLPPLTYIHFIDINSSITFLEVGPQTVVLQSHERLVVGPLPFIKVPLGSYCVILDPVSKYERGKPSVQKLGQSKVKFSGEPFPLYPGERLQNASNFDTTGDYSNAVKPLPVIKANSGIRLEAILDYTDGKVQRKAGDRWQLCGPITYKPVPQVKIIGYVEPVVIKPNQALRLKAEQDCIDQNGVKRVTGEEWLVSRQGAYLPGIFEQVMGVEDWLILTRETGLHLKATQTHKEASGKERLAGDQWLLTGEEAEQYSPQIGVEVIKSIRKTVLPKGKYCVVLNPVDEKGKPHLGKKELRVGCCSFFLHPGEQLEVGIQKSNILAADEAVVVQAKEEFDDKMTKDLKRRSAGDRWRIQGPLEYIPPIEVEVVNKLKMIPLDKNDGIYVRDTQTGKVRMIMGPRTYMLTAYEELWEKELSPTVEQLLKQGGGAGKGDIRKLAYYDQSIDPLILKGRDKTRVVSYRCPTNTAVQVYNYQKQTDRVVFGPDLVILGPNEDFNVLSLSAGKPKEADALKSLCLMLGPDFISDILEVETCDHARLRIQLAFNNHFKYEKGNKVMETTIFSVPDFIGFACRQVASRIRSLVAQTPFDDFHRHSSQVIQRAVFGVSNDGKTLNRALMFPVNNLVITSVDVQSIEPVDIKMRDSLSKSVQQAIEIATNSVEAAATHEANRNEQAARGQLERQKLINEIESEKERAKLYELRAIASAVESSGQAKAEAQAKAESVLIECRSEIEAARLKAQAEEIVHFAELDTQNMVRTGELAYQKSVDELEIAKAKGLSDIEVNKFANMVNAIGAKTISAIATSGPEMKVKLLQSLGLKSMLVTDGSNPINLFSAADGLVAEQKTI